MNIGDDTMKKRITFTLDESLINKLKDISEKSGVPQSRIVNDGVGKRIKELEELLKK